MATIDMSTTAWWCSERERRVPPTVTSYNDRESNVWPSARDVRRAYVTEPSPVASQIRIVTVVLAGNPLERLPLGCLTPGWSGDAGTTDCSRSLRQPDPQQHCGHGLCDVFVTLRWYPYPRAMNARGANATLKDLTRLAFAGYAPARTWIVPDERVPFRPWGLC